MKKMIFTGSAVALVTPMKKDGSIDYAKMLDLIDFQIDNGTDAIVTCGTTGESATMSHEEHVEVIRKTIEHVNGRCPVIAGTGSNETAVAVSLSQEAERLGADGLLIVTPYYNKTSQAGLIAHYHYIADRVNLPIIVYNVPSRTGVNVLPKTYFELSKHPNIVAAKEASGNIGAVAEIASLCGDNLTLYSGNDDQIVPLLSLGGKGVISVLANVAPAKTHAICEEYLNGNVNESRRLQLEYMELINALFMDVNPIPVKEALNLMGWECGSCRLPLIDLSDDKREVLRQTLKKYQLC